MDEAPMSSKAGHSTSSMFSIVKVSTLGKLHLSEGIVVKSLSLITSSVNVPEIVVRSGNSINLFLASLRTRMIVDEKAVAFIVVISLSLISRTVNVPEIAVRSGNSINLFLTSFRVEMTVDEKAVASIVVISLSSRLRCDPTRCKH